ncbi:hypothetical protein OG792_32590 [Micromonospora sp. NBC_01699]|uniref:hypothetical protein n=1 Tax=Micromonospora sp. NBC_01699 TaxID=2975984 RepID=UPI002E2A265F|nr:hypothetical protein [Micromonospora sp. NBC_01699]
MADSPAASSREASDGIEAAVRELRTAEAVAFGGVGFAGRIMPSTEAYNILEVALPSRLDEVRPHICELLTHGSPAGKVYAATLLARFDPAAARAAWEALTDERAEFTTYTGCLIDQTTVGEYATAQLDQG